MRQLMFDAPGQVRWEEVADPVISHRAAAIVLGDFVDCDEPGGALAGKSVLASLLKEFNGPVVHGFPSGHTRGPIVTLPFGVRARVVANGHPRVIIEEAGVE